MMQSLGAAGHFSPPHHSRRDPPWDGVAAAAETSRPSAAERARVVRVTQKRAYSAQQEMASRGHSRRAYLPAYHRPVWRHATTGKCPL